MGFMSARLANGRVYPTFDVIEDCARDALAIKIVMRLTAQRVIRTPDQLCDREGTPGALGSNNGSEF